MQTRTHSLIEAGANTGTGFIVSWILTLYVLPYWGFITTAKTALEITVVYTIASIVRTYAIRRIFNESAKVEAITISDRTNRVEIRACIGIKKHCESENCSNCVFCMEKPHDSLYRLHSTMRDYYIHFLPPKLSCTHDVMLDFHRGYYDGHFRLIVGNHYKCSFHEPKIE